MKQEIKENILAKLVFDFYDSFRPLHLSSLYSIKNLGWYVSDTLKFVLSDQIPGLSAIQWDMR